MSSLIESKFPKYQDDLDTLFGMKHLKFEDEFQFTDFLNMNDLTDEQCDILSSFSFSTVITKNRHVSYFNGMTLELNQLNYGVKRCDIGSEDELKKQLLDTVEFSRLPEKEKNEILDLFILSVENVIEQVENIEKRLP